MAARAHPMSSQPRTSLVAVLAIVLVALLSGAQAQVVDLAAAVVPAFACLTTAAGYSAATCAALGGLYAATNGPSWSTKTGWSAAAAGTPTNFCSFHGVTCVTTGSPGGRGLTVLCVSPPAPCAACAARRAGAQR
jgi:hypothetical protein